RGARAHERHRRALVRRPALPRPAARRPGERAAVGRARAPGAPAPRVVHRPAGAQVPAAGVRLARPRGHQPPGHRCHPHAGARRVIEEMRLRDLGVIAEATLPMGSGFTAITGETGASKTMVVTGLGLLLGQRADSGTVRAGAEQAEVAGVWIVPQTGPVADRVQDAGGSLEPLPGDAAAELYVGRTIGREGRSRATVGGRTAPAGVLADLAEELVVVHGQSDQLRLRSGAAQRTALDRFGGAEVADALTAYRDAWDRWRALDAELTT